MLTGIRLFFRYCLIGLFAAVFFFVSEWVRFVTVPLLNDQSHFEFEVKPGQSLGQVAKTLDDQGILPHSRFFIVMAYLRGATHKIQAGEYRIDPKTTAHDVLNKWIAGDVVLRRITLVEGWTVQTMLDELHESPYLIHDAKALTQVEVAKQLQIKKPSIEGLFFPETYTFAKNTSELEILKKAHRMMQQRLQEAWTHRSAHVDAATPYEALIVASLVEKETAIESERAIVAGVIYRRLRKKMLLQIDPTVIYALGNAYTGALSYSDLSVKSPYNTYVTRGLPPGPIANPGLASITAAMHPDQSDVLYFVANGGGRHHFSNTLAEHHQMVKTIRAKKAMEQSNEPIHHP